MSVRALRRGTMAGRGAAAEPVTYTLFGSADDVIVYSGPSPNYAAIVDGSEARTLDTVTETTETVGQYFFSPSYANYEYFVEFDTSGVVGTVTSVTLSLWGLGDWTTTNFVIEARAFDFGPAISTADYRTSAELSALPLLATKDTSGWAVGSYNDFTSEAAFLAAINPAGMTRIVVSSSRYRAATTPTTGEYLAFASADTTGTDNDPKLVIEAT